MSEHTSLKTAIAGTVLSIAIGLAQADSPTTAGPGMMGGMGLGMMGGCAGMGPGMMGGYGGMGPGMMGPGMMGMGPGMMGPGMMGGYGGAGPGMMGPGMMGGSCPGAADLNLTEQQRTQIAKIQQESHTKRTELTNRLWDERGRLREQYYSDKRDAKQIREQYRKIYDLRREMAELSLDTHARIEAVLTKEQKERWHRFAPWSLEE